MNLQPQCVYGGTYSNLSTFRRREIRYRHRRSLLDLFIGLLIVAALLGGYFLFSQHLDNRAVAEDAHHACIATTIASIENSDGL